ncbi:carbohydrate kinase family protein [Shimia abyssi]|uniref:Sugar/nucleoside kinase (Ribokinase family) n=1 Tax=Shimia abyssi TaxID=1662395 RepID=A0A2P8FEH5_9RHOB|nr:PfkB family carbohydrate kinase [Shimia abyssi]PSL20099.1 sugar/nucleoside kinase (ribokinase family) [Shimia abyssi]
MKAPILSAGRLYCDLVFANTPRLPTFGTEVFAPGLSLHAGGGAFITGATLSALGHSVWQFSTLPARPFDSVALADLAAHGVVATATAAAGENVDPQVTVAIAHAGDRAFLTRADGPAIPDPASLDFAKFAHLHIGELSTLEEMPELLERARAANMTVSLDCGWQDSYAPNVGQLIAAIDVFLPNESEVAALSAIGIPENCAPLTVIKGGKTGARARTRTSDTWTYKSTTQVEVLDATGAGDAFNAGFLSCWLNKIPLEQCLTKGNEHGTAAVQAFGGASYLTQMETA